MNVDLYYEVPSRGAGYIRIMDNPDIPISALVDAFCSAFSDKKQTTHPTY
jgi:hypothetical protein